MPNPVRLVPALPDARTVLLRGSLTGIGGLDSAADSEIPTGTIAYGDIQNVSARKLLGNSSTASAAMSEQVVTAGSFAFLSGATVAVTTALPSPVTMGANARGMALDTTATATSIGSPLPLSGGGTSKVPIYSIGTSQWFIG